MIAHIVLFRWKPGTPDAAIDAGMDALRGLQHSIPGIADVLCGVDFSGRAQGFTHALIIRFADRESFDAYGPHPAHRAVVDTFLRPILDSVIDFDFALTLQDAP